MTEADREAFRLAAEADALDVAQEQIRAVVVALAQAADPGVVVDVQFGAASSAPPVELAPAQRVEASGFTGLGGMLAIAVAAGWWHRRALARQADTHAAEIMWDRLRAEHDRGALIDAYQAELAEALEAWELAVRANQVLWSAIGEEVLP